MVHAQDAAPADAAVVCTRRLVSATLLAEAWLPTLSYQMNAEGLICVETHNVLATLNASKWHSVPEQTLS